MNVIPIGDSELQFAVQSVIYDALRSGDQHTISVDTMKSVNSQYGSEILALPNLPDQQRRHATEALHRLILSAVLDSKR